MHMPQASRVSAYSTGAWSETEHVEAKRPRRQSKGAIRSTILIVHIGHAVPVIATVLFVTVASLYLMPETMM